jgi:hypothetical protein
MRKSPCVLYYKIENIKCYIVLYLKVIIYHILNTYMQICEMDVIDVDSMIATAENFLSGKSIFPST